MGSSGLDGPMLVGMLIGGLVGLSLGGLIAAVLLRAAAHWVAQMDVPMGKAFGIGVVNMVLGYIVSLGAKMLGVAAGNPVVSLVSLPLGFLLQAVIITVALPVNFGKGLLITLVMMLLVLAIALVLGGGCYAIMTLMGVH